MRRDITVTAERRSTVGKNEARRLRVQGNIPAVLYGTGGETVSVTVNPKEVNRVLHSKGGHNTIFDVQLVGGDKCPVMVVDAQHDPIKGNLLHIDLRRIDLTKRLRVKVPVHTTGDPVGVKTFGGLLELVNREIEVECLPDDIPEHFTSDISEMMVGQSLRASQVELSGSMRLVSNPESVICHVVVIRTTEVEAAAEDAAAVPAAEGKGEPEVIKKGKKEEEAAPEGKKK